MFFIRLPVVLALVSVNALAAGGGPHLANPDFTKGDRLDAVTCPRPTPMIEHAT